MKHFLIFLLVSLHILVVSAQEVYDEVLLTNGVEYKGKVLEITETDIRFSHKGETLVYTFPKTQVFRIAFASGRTEVFTSLEHGANQPAVVKGNTINTQVVAIVPFRFIHRNEPGNWEDMAYRIQEEAFYLAKAAPIRYQLQPLSVTNSTLLKKGIKPQELRAYTMDELCSILGVGYIITGEIQLRNTGAISSGSQTTIQNTRPGTKPTGKPGQTVTTTTTTSNNFTKTYQTTVKLLIFDAAGRTVYAKDRTSIWSSADAYKLTLNYLLKRTPLH